MSHSGIFSLPLAITVLIVEEFREIKKYIVETSEKISLFRYPYGFSDFGYPSFDLNDVFSGEMTGKNTEKDFLVAIPLKPIEKEEEALSAEVRYNDMKLGGDGKMSVKQNAVIHKIRSLAKKNDLHIDKTYLNSAGEAVLEISQSLSHGGIDELDELFGASLGEIT
jgi:hypothetical protein